MNCTCFPMPRWFPHQLKERHKILKRKHGITYWKDKHKSKYSTAGYVHLHIQQVTHGCSQVNCKECLGITDINENSAFTWIVPVTPRKGFYGSHATPLRNQKCNSIKKERKQIKGRKNSPETNPGGGFCFCLYYKRNWDEGTELIHGEQKISIILVIKILSTLSLCMSYTLLIVQIRMAFFRAKFWRPWNCLLWVEEETFHQPFFFEVSSPSHGFQPVTRSIRFKSIQYSKPERNSKVSFTCTYMNNVRNLHLDLVGATLSLLAAFRC